MTEVQGVLLEIFKCFKNICERHHLRYFAIGGTCIGAVRHKGFIPWDDDLDVAMPYDDYRLFLHFARNELPANYEIYTSKENPHWYRNYVKIHDITTTYAEDESQEFYDRYTGVFIDIMPIFGLPKGIINQEKYSLINCFYLNMNRIQRLYYLNDNHKSFKLSRKIIYGFLKVTQLFYGEEKNNYMLYDNRIEETFDGVKFDNSDKILFAWRNSVEIFLKSSFHYKVILPYELFADACEVPFEDTVIRIPVGYDRYLRSEFGDYTIIPPVDKQIKHNPVIQDLKKSYKEYRRGL